jgi:hypothetical protein
MKTQILQQAGPSQATAQQGVELVEVTPNSMRNKNLSV